MEINTELVKVNPTEFGIEEVKAQQIADQFKPMLEKMVELEKEYNEIIKLPIDEPETAKKAKELRLKYVKVRTRTAEIHKQQKDFYLKAGRYIDGWKNAQILASNGIEETLQKIENYKEIKEAERIKALNDERIEALKPFEFDATGQNLGSMSQTVWENFLSGIEIGYKQRKEAEAKAEMERIENIRLDKVENSRRIEIAPYVQFITENKDLRQMSEEDYQKLLTAIKQAKIDYDKEQEKIRQENERLKAETEAKEKQLAEERAKAEAERKKLEEVAKKEREEAERKLKAEQEAARIAAEKAAAEKERLEKEIKEREAAEEAAKIKEQKEKEAAEKKAKNAPDKVKIEKFRDELKALKLPEVKNLESVQIVSDISTLINKTIAFINSKIESL